MRNQRGETTNSRRARVFELEREVTTSDGPVWVPVGAEDGNPAPQFPTLLAAQVEGERLMGVWSESTAPAWKLRVIRVYSVRTVVTTLTI